MGAGGERGTQITERQRAGRRRFWWLGLMALVTVLVAVAVVVLSESAAAQTSGNIWLEGTPVAGGTMLIHAPDFCPYRPPTDTGSPTPPPTPPLPPGRYDATPPPAPPATGAPATQAVDCSPGAGSGTGSGHG